VTTITNHPTRKISGNAFNIERISQEVMRRLADMPQPDAVNNGEPAPISKNGYLEMETPIGVSVRHVHLCPEHVEILFGQGYDLSVYNELYQKGYYAAREQVMVVGRKRCIEKVRVLGPPRAYSQVELSQTDALIIGMKLPIATNGADPVCQPITLVGPAGAVTLPGKGGGGAFIARRHIHLSDVTADKLGVKSGDLLDLRINGPSSHYLARHISPRQGWLAYGSPFRHR
jgi:putative phosphotransacetylase